MSTGPTRRARFLGWLAGHAVARPRTVLVLALLALAAALTAAVTRLELRTSNLDLVDPELPAVARFRAFAAEFGSPNVLVVVLEGKPVDGGSTSLRVVADRLAPRLLALPEVRSVVGHLPASGEVLAGLGRSPYLESRDGGMLFLLVQPVDREARASTIEPFVAGVRHVLGAAHLDAEGIAWGLTGLPQYALDDRDTVARDASRLAWVSLGLVAALFVTAYATPWRPLFATVSLLVAAGVTLGVAAVVPGHLTLLSAFVVSILFGLGDDFGVHLVDRIEEAAAAGVDERSAIASAVAGLADSLSTAGLTTVAAFLALLASGFRGFAELGLIAAVGIVASLVAVVTVLPALLVLVPIPRRRGRALEHRRSGRLLPSLVRPAVALPILGLALAGPWLVGLPGFDGDYLNLEPAGSEAVRLERAMIERSEVSPQFAAFTVASRRAALELAMALRSEPTVGDVHTIAEVDQLARLLAAREQEGGGATTGSDWRRELTELAAPFASAEGRFAVYAHPRGNLWDPAERDAFLAAMHRLDPDGSLALTGMPVLGKFMIDLSLTAMRRASLLAGLAVVLLVAVDLRSARLTVLALTPTVFAFGLLLVAMRGLGLAWNPLAVMAVPVILGYGVDSGVHLVHRFASEGGDLGRTLAGSGRAVLLSTATTLAGFAPLGLTAHQGFASFAKVLTLGIAASLVASLLVLPWLLARIGPHRS